MLRLCIVLFLAQYLLPHSLLLQDKMHKLFESQLDNERVYLVLREHPILLFSKLGFICFLALMGIAGYFGYTYLGSSLWGDTFTKFLQYLFSLYYLGLTLGALLVFIFYYLSLQIITDIRMVDVDQHALFGRKVTEIQIENIEEVTSHTTGFIATVFNYGNVLVQTSGSLAEFEFNHVAHPEHVKKLILDLYEQRRHQIGQTKNIQHPEHTH